MPRAFSILPTRFEDGRHLALETGLQAAGYEVMRTRGPATSDEDVLITWTRHQGHKHNYASEFEKSGGTVIVAEEPHIKGIPPGLNNRLYCLCLDDHQAGTWYIGGNYRWDRFGIELWDWRGNSKPEDIIFVRAQRGIGSPTMICQKDWHQRMIPVVQKHTTRKVQMLEHPKNLKIAGREPNPPWKDLREICHALVTWSSHDGTAALIHGVPVFCLAPAAFFKASACDDISRIENPWKPPNRLSVMRNLAWAHWTLPELKSGYPFDLLRRVIRERKATGRCSESTTGLFKPRGV